jgi:hypothetical protein
MAIAWTALPPSMPANGTPSSAVDAGDINGNGTAEIFVTRLDAHGKLDSVVLEWNGSGLQPIATDQRWYFRVTDDPEAGRLLTGQRRGTPSANDTGGLYADTHFLPGVFELDLDRQRLPGRPPVSDCPTT